VLPGFSLDNKTTASAISAQSNVATEQTIHSSEFSTLKSYDKAS
jgi:hypothetical protein